MKVALDAIRPVCRYIKDGDTETYTGRNSHEMEAGMKVTCRQAKGCQGLLCPPELRGILPYDLQREHSPVDSSVLHLASRTLRNEMPVILG